MASGPRPRSARLGFWGLAAVAVVGVALLPMAGSPRAVAQRPAEKPAGQASAQSAVNEPETKPAVEPPLRGRIIDEEGKPVTDAIIQLISMSSHATQETATGRDGRYHLDRLWFPGEHRLRIFSDRCLGLTDFKKCPRVILESQKPNRARFHAQGRPSGTPAGAR